MKRPRKRTLLMVLLPLTGGAIINVAVAWGCARQPVQLSTYRQGHINLDDKPNPLPFDAAWMAKYEWKSTEREIYWWETTEWFGVQQRMLWHETPDRATRGWRAIRILAGWPALSLDGARQVNRAWTPVDSPADAWSDIHSVPIQVRVDAQPGVKSQYWQLRPLPMCPSWPGFAINTVFYAAVLWVMFAGIRGPGKIRRVIRTRRGQCPACGYPVGTSEVCTECGLRLVKGNEQSKGK